MTSPLEAKFAKAVRRLARGAGIDVYDDITNVEEPFEGLRVQLTGEVQQPAGEWWYHNGQWFSGDRTRISDRAEIGGNTVLVMEGFRLPSSMELDVWQAHAMNVDGVDSGIYVDIYAPERDEILYEYDAAGNNGTIQLGNPLAVLGQDSDLLEFRLRNDTGGSVIVTGSVVVSVQTVL